MDMVEVGGPEIVALLIAPVFIIAVVQVIKKAFKPSSRFVPLIALALGLVDGFLLHLSHETAHTLAEALVAGAIAGLTAVGLYAGGTSVANTPSKEGTP